MMGCLGLLLNSVDYYNWVDFKGPKHNRYMFWYFAIVILAFMMGTKIGGL